MTEQHPIIPSLGLIAQWLDEFYDPAAPSGMAPGETTTYVATQAAQWGADQELEECCKWLVCNHNYSVDVDLLRITRRLRPSSLKKRALKELDRSVHPDGAELSRTQVYLIRRALKQLDD